MFPLALVLLSSPSLSWASCSVSELPKQVRENTTPRYFPLALVFLGSPSLSCASDSVSELPKQVIENITQLFRLLLIS